MHDMFETIASGVDSPIARYTKSLFIGSLHDNTHVADTDLDTDTDASSRSDEDEDEEGEGDDDEEGDDDDEEDMKDEELQSSEGAWEDIGQQAQAINFGDLADVEDVTDEDEPTPLPEETYKNEVELAKHVRDALSKFSGLESFKYSPLCLL